MLKLKIIACDVLNREISYFASKSKHYTDVTFLHQGLHDTPDKLREMLQAEVEKANGEFPYNYYNTSPKYDYIIISYGLCSNGIVGITSKNVPMVIPRAHDCITLLLGSKEKYKAAFTENPGTFWFSSGWIERAWQPSEHKYKVLLEDYTNRYGEDNAEFLMEMEQNWMKEYKRAGFIYWNNLTNNCYYRDFTKESAKFFDWEFMELEGSGRLIENVLNGEFKEDEVLIVPPGSTIKASYDDSIINNA